MLKKISIIIVCVFANNSLFALPLVPDIYAGAGLSNDNDSYRYIDKNSLTKNSLSEKSSDLFLSLGIRPIDLPILGGFRFELQYLKSYASDFAKDKIGVAAYYDFFRFLPIVNPYIGFVAFSPNYKSGTIIGNDSSNSLYTGIVGVNADIPIVGLNLFGEYRFGQNFQRLRSEDIGKFRQCNQSILFGMKYYFLR